MSRERKELFSEKVSAGSRTYYFDVKESADGIKYFVISESRQVGEEPHKHNRIMVFQEYLEAFIEAFNTSINFMMKGSRSKAHSIEQIRYKYPRAYVKWTEEEDTRLRSEYTRGKTINELAEIFQRKPSAIRSRLQKLRLL